MKLSFKNRGRLNRLLSASYRHAPSPLSFPQRQFFTYDITEDFRAPAGPGIFLNDRRTLSTKAALPQPPILQALFTPQKQINEQVDLTSTHINNPSFYLL